MQKGKGRGLAHPLRRSEYRLLWQQREGQALATLIAVYTSEGCVGRCDARCHDATTPECDCICGGANHGVGQSRAIENTRALAEQWLQEYAHRKGFAEVKYELGQLVQQPSLW